jgi:hypothetical protein
VRNFVVVEEVRRMRFEIERQDLCGKDAEDASANLEFNPYQPY